MAKLSRKELLKKEDAFQVAAAQSAQWMRQHKRSVTLWSVLGFILIAGIWGGLAFVKHRDHRASNLLADALDLEEAAIVPDGSEPSDADDAAPTFPTEEARRTAAIEAFQAVIDAAPSSEVADLAQLYLGNLQQESGDLEAAEKTFAALVDDLSSSDSIYFLALERLAYLQEARGESDAAIATLGRLAQSDEAFYRDVALYHQARIYEAKGDVERARTLLERIEKDFPQSPVRDEVTNRLALLGRSAPEDEPATGSEP